MTVLQRKYAPLPYFLMQLKIQVLQRKKFCLRSLKHNQLKEMDKTINKLVEIFAMYVPNKVVFTSFRETILNIRIHKNESEKYSLIDK